MRHDEDNRRRIIHEIPRNDLNHGMDMIMSTLEHTSRSSEEKSSRIVIHQNSVDYQTILETFLSQQQLSNCSAEAIQNCVTENVPGEAKTSRIG